MLYKLKIKVCHLAKCYKRKCYEKIIATQNVTKLSHFASNVKFHINANVIYSSSEKLYKKAKN